MEGKLKTSRREYIAHSVAMKWLLDAESIIAHGGSPMKLSDIVRCHISEQLSKLPENIALPSKAGITLMCNKSLAFALDFLKAGRFPTVAKHFSK